MTAPEGPAAPLDGRALGLATGIAVVVAAVALVAYVLPVSYGVDALGVGQVLGINGAPPDSDASRASGDPADDPGRGVEVTNETRLRRFEVAWPHTAGTGPSADGYTREGATTTVDLPIAADNVTRVTVNLTWTDDNATAGQATEPDTLELVLETPSGNRSEPVRATHAQGVAGSVEVTLELSEPPATSIVQAASREEVREAASAPAAVPGGTWKVHVTVVDAGDAEAQGMALPVVEDAGATWRLESTFSRFELTIADLGPTGVRSQTSTFELAAKEGMEHKVLLEEGTTLEYAWQTTGPLYYDFHGEPKGDAENFESYETGTRSAASGTFTAPFTGTHGWYWENKGSEPITITLTTTGDYADGFTT